MKKYIGTVSAAALVLAAGYFAPAFADGMVDPVQAALDAPDRPVKDRARDEARKPAEVLRFAGVKPGMTVLDINAASGWYTELLSHVVGPEGKVYAQNGPFYKHFYADKTVARYADGHLKNVTVYEPGTELVDLPEGSVDVVTMVLGFHDYFAAPDVRPLPDVAPILASIKKAMKPGGVLLVVDHAALAGSGLEAPTAYHRIDPAFARAQLEAAGFKLAASSDMLANPADDHVTKVWEGAIRGHTDRFIYKFTK